VQDETEKALGSFSRKLHDAETQYPAYQNTVLGIQDAIVYWNLNLHRAELPFLVHTDHATLSWFRTQPHLTICQIDISTVLQNSDCEVRHISGVKNQVADALSCHPDF
jgi:hypothetical protein